MTLKSIHSQQVYVYIS